MLETGVGCKLDAHSARARKDQCPVRCEVEALCILSAENYKWRE
jgi:hypothetical protein